MHAHLFSEALVGARRADLLATADAARRAGDRRQARRGGVGAGASGVLPALRSALGWWLVAAGLRLAVSPHAACPPPGPSPLRGSSGPR